MAVSPGNDVGQAPPASAESPEKRPYHVKTKERKKTRYPQRLRGGAYALRYKDLVERDGEKCFLCGKHPPEVKLGIHHRNHDPTDQRLSNQELTCTEPTNCNTLESNGKRARDRRSASTEKEKMADRGGLEDELASAEIRLNQAYEPEFRRWLFDRVSKSKPLYVKEAIDGSAEDIGANPETTRKYLDKAVSPQGPYALVKIRIGKRYFKRVVSKRGPEHLTHLTSMHGKFAENLGAQLKAKKERIGADELCRVMESHDDNCGGC